MVNYFPTFSQYLNEAKSHRYVLRLTSHPKEDLKRNWSAWMGGDSPNGLFKLTKSEVSDNLSATNWYKIQMFTDTNIGELDEFIYRALRSFDLPKKLHNFETLRKMVHDYNSKQKPWNQYDEDLDELFDDAVEVIDNIDVEARYHPAHKGFVEVHYEGLGAFILEVNNLNDAIAMVQQREDWYSKSHIMHEGDGHFYASEVLDYHLVPNVGDKDHYIFVLR